MSRAIIVLPGAESDIEDAALWYRENDLQLSLDFTSEVHAILARIADSPLQFPSAKRNPEVRRALLNRFPYKIFFVIRPDAIVVFRVLHTARHDRSWEQHIPSTN